VEVCHIQRCLLANCYVPQPSTSSGKLWQYSQ